MRKCAGCPALVADPGTKRCRACYRALAAPHPLRTWREKTGTSFEVLAGKIGSDVRTVQRIASGEPASKAIAMKLARETGLEFGALVRGTRWT